MSDRLSSSAPVTDTSRNCCADNTPGENEMYRWKKNVTRVVKRHLESPTNFHASAGFLVEKRGKKIQKAREIRQSNLDRWKIHLGRTLFRARD